MTQLTNPFAPTGAVTKPSATNSIVATEQSRAIAEVQASMVIARNFPRNPVTAMDNILNACTRMGLAETAVYQYSRGGSDISGASIRLAETLAQYWGNIQYGLRTLEQGNDYSLVQAYAWDIETNTKSEIAFRVDHVRATKKGSYTLTDPRDVYELIANNGARRLRACLLKVIPSDVVDTAVKQCEQTLHNNIEITKDLIKNLLASFAEYGVSKEQIEARIQRRIDSIQPAQVSQLKKIYSSLKDGMSSPGDWFEPVTVVSEVEDKSKNKTESLKNKLKKTLEDAPVVTSESEPVEAQESAHLEDLPMSDVDMPF